MKMLRLKYLILIVFALILNGCGQSVVETLKVPQAPDANAPGAGSTIVVLPFADYSYADDLTSAYRRNLKVTEALTDNLSAQGFGMPIAEDVFSYLVGQKVIAVADYENTSNVSLTNELSNDWSSEMKGKIRHYLQEQQLTQKNKVEKAPGTHALNTKAITKLGREFQADYVMRGRILEFKTRQDPTWNPMRKGLLPVIIGGSSQILYGFAGSEEYDERNQMMTGGAYGLIAANQTSWPTGGGDINGGITYSQIAWAAFGGLLGSQSSQSGRVDQAVVQLRIWVQDASSGQVVWTNWAMVRVSPETIFSEVQYDDLFNTAIENGVSTFVESFVLTGL